MSFLLRFFRPKSSISNPMEVVHAIHLSSDLKWEFDPQYDAKEVFQKLQIIGKGGFGIVCKVLHIPSQTILAGKLINPKLVNSPNSKKEIDHEIELMKEVESDYTIRYYGSVQFEGSMMILMEYCDCGSLRNILDAREQVLSEDQIAIVMRDLLLGLQIIHTRYRIVHRDIKAANILLTSSGGIKIADFGVSRRFEKTGTIHTMTIVGTPYWMAPEVINGTAYSFPADLWSVGITAVELAEGAPPYVELAPTKAMIEIFVKGFPGYRFKKMHSQEFMDFVSHCVQKKDTDRWDIPHLLEHPFIKRAERMPRLEVLSDLIKCGLKVTKSQVIDNSKLFSSKNNNCTTGSDPFASSAQKNVLNNAPNLNSATNFDTFGNSAVASQKAAQLKSGTSFDTFSIGGANNNGFDSAVLNSAANLSSRSGMSFDSFAAAHKNSFDSAALNSGTSFGNNFDSAALNSGTSFGNNFDSAALNSGTSFGNNFDSAALNSGTSFGNGFDSAALNSGTSFGNGFDSAALNSGTSFGAGGNGFDSAALTSGTSFDSFAANYGGNRFDSAALNSGTNFGNNFDSAALNSGSGFDSFSAAYKNNSRNPGFDSAALNSGANLQSSSGFDSFAANYRNGFDSAALNSGANFGGNVKSSAGFDSFAANYGNGFDSAALNSGSNFGYFGQNNGFDSAALNSGTNFNSNSFAANKNGFDSAALNSSPGFDSFAQNMGNSFKPSVGFDTFAKESSGQNSQDNSATSFDKFASADGANLMSASGFDSFNADYRQNRNGFDSFVSTKDADLKSAGGLENLKSGIIKNGSNFDSFISTRSSDSKSSIGFDTFELENPDNNAHFAKPTSPKFNDSTFQSFDSFNASQSQQLKDQLQAQQQQQLQQQQNEQQIQNQQQQQQQQNDQQLHQQQLQQPQQNDQQLHQQQQQQNDQQLHHHQQQQNDQQLHQQQLQQPFHNQQQQSQLQIQQQQSEQQLHQQQLQQQNVQQQLLQQKPLEKTRLQPLQEQVHFPVHKPNYNSFQQRQPPINHHQFTPSASSTQTLIPHSPSRDIPHVTFAALPDNQYRQIARMNSLRIPYVNYSSIVQSAKEGKQLPPVFYQQDDSLIAQQRIKQQQHQFMMKKKLIQPFRIGVPNDEEEEKVPTWSPPKPIVAFLIVVAILYGPEGFVLSMMFIAAAYFALCYGKKNAKSNEGLVPRKFNGE